MKAVKWSPERLIARREEMGATAADMLRVVRQGERVVVQIQESQMRRILGDENPADISMAQFRQGCVTSVEASVGMLPVKGRVLAEIHRRLDRVSALDRRSAGWRSRLVSVYDFAGAWALAARLMREGLEVSVVEKNRALMYSENGNSRADVEIVIPIGPVAEWS